MADKPKDRPTTGFTGDDAPDGSPERRGPDPLRTSVASRTWVGISIFAVVLILIVDFVLQNTNSVRVSWLFWHWHVPLAIALLVAVAAGILVTWLAGTVRMVQVRRRVRRERKRR